MLDINLLRAEKGGNPDLVRESQRRRHKKVEIVDEVIAVDVEVGIFHSMFDEARGLTNCQVGISDSTKQIYDGHWPIVYIFRALSFENSSRMARLLCARPIRMLSGVSFHEGGSLSLA
jgi:hypothetical protein